MQRAELSATKATVILRFVSTASIVACLAFGPVEAQDTTRQSSRDSTGSAAKDSSPLGRVAAVRAGVSKLGRQSLTLARRGERIVFGTDSAVETWTRHQDRTSNTLRKLSPIAFWVPIVAVASTPAIWADEAQDGHQLNAQYAGSATAALALGFIAS